MIKGGIRAVEGFGTRNFAMLGDKSNFVDPALLDRMQNSPWYCCARIPKTQSKAL
jgi:hypothetical protein